MADPLIGKQLGDYNIQELLGRGGMARVYKGFDERLQRFAAVKVINSDFATADQAEYTERFRREARSIARLHHPNIVGVFQFGEFEGSYYMAMVFVEGKDLRQILKEYAENGQRMPSQDVMNIIRGIGSALDYAHSRGVIHRDIKPSNIMLDAENRAILTDFGLALNAQEGTLGDTFGSAHYIAPEQAVSSAKAVPQSDLYSLGVVLYEMLAGKVPFDDPSAMSVALKHLNDAPPPPRLFNPELSLAVEKVILKLLDKDANQRYASGALLTQALEHALLSEPSGDVVEDTVELPVARAALTPPKSAPVIATDTNKTAAYVERSTPPRSASSSQDGQSTVIGMAAPPSSPSLAVPPSDKPTASPLRMLVPIAIGVVLVLLVGTGLLFISGALKGGSGSPTALPSPVNTTPVASTVPVIINTQAATVSANSTKATKGTPSVSSTKVVAAAASHTPVPPTATRTPTTAVLTTVPTTGEPIVGATTGATETPEGAGEPPSITLYYDEDQFVLVNTSNSTVNISKIKFIQRGDSEATTRVFDALGWSVAGLQNSPDALQPKFCFQIFRNDKVLGSPMPAADCSTQAPHSYRAAWARVAENQRFWIAPDPANAAAATFDVTLDDKTLVTCKISDGQCKAILPTTTAGVAVALLSTDEAGTSTSTPEPTIAVPTSTATVVPTRITSFTVTRLPLPEITATAATSIVTVANVQGTIEATANSDESVTVLSLFYDDDQFVVVNTDSSAVNISKLKFIQRGDTEATTRTLDTLLWYATGSQYSPDTFPPKYCFQAFRNDKGYATPMPTSECLLTPQSFRIAWAKVNDTRQVWIANANATTFDVTVDDKIVATCTISAGYCKVNLPPELQVPLR
ncbi:MAG: serine/threonine-protein kinase [Chloroflexota bacterium]